MKSKHILLFLLFSVNILFPQNKLNVTVNNRPPIVKIDSSAFKTDKGISLEKYNDLLGKIIVLEKEIANNKQSFFESIANWYSFVLICLSIAIGLLGILGYRSLGRRFDDHRHETTDNIEQLKAVILYQINEKLNIELQKIDAYRKSFYDTTINDLVKKYYELSSILETIKIVYLTNTGNQFVPNALSNEEELMPTTVSNAFDDEINTTPNNNVSPEDNNEQ